MSTPLHERIRSDIEARILSGILLPGDHIPIEHELMRTYGCARMTVNKAISALAAAGLVDRRKRFGTVVAKPRLHSMILDVPDLVQEVVGRGHSYRWEVRFRRVRSPKRTEAVESELARDGKLLDVRGVHFSDGKPLAVEDRLVSLSSVPEISDASFDDRPPGAWLLENVPGTEAEPRISAVNADADVASYLQAPLGLSCLVIERRTWRGADPITRVRQIFDGATYDLFARFGHDETRKRSSR